MSNRCVSELCGLIIQRASNHKLGRQKSVMQKLNFVFAAQVLAVEVNCIQQVIFKGIILVKIR